MKAGYALPLLPPNLSGSPNCVGKLDRWSHKSSNKAWVPEKWSFLTRTIEFWRIIHRWGTCGFNTKWGPPMLPYLSVSCMKEISHCCLKKDISHLISPYPPMRGDGCFWEACQGNIPNSNHVAKRQEISPFPPLDRQYSFWTQQAHHTGCKIYNEQWGITIY